ncbi:hypothetical protein EZS27_009813 [termite gut metagenome]|uniref:Uncharacterized protein n=1 Tax=termite gut metagenome TaxID=433724 RepID=A0A5J4S8J9_9ZZZZ
MTIEENNQNIGAKPALTEKEGGTFDYIVNCMKDAAIPFQKACSQPNLHYPLNENKFTQMYVEQVEVKIKSHPNIGVKNQYSDIFMGTKGVPDFYFHKVEEGVHHFPLFVVESKILPTPGEKREREYVIGNKENGAMERYKIEKHGKGFNVCGILGFVEKETFDYWITSINRWVEELSGTNDFWKKDEILTKIENKLDYFVSKSIAHRTSSQDISLYHLWIFTHKQKQ